MNESTRNPSVSVLLVGEFEDDRLLMHGIFSKLGWRLFEARSRKHALECLDRHAVQVVMAEGSFVNWNWKQVLHHLRSMARPPQLIVTSRLADDSLWAEVLNVGAYDLLARPFHVEEVERVVAAALRHFDLGFATLAGVA